MKIQNFTESLQNDEEAFKIICSIKIDILRYKLHRKIIDLICTGYPAGNQVDGLPRGCSRRGLFGMAEKKI